MVIKCDVFKFRILGIISIGAELRILYLVVVKIGIILVTVEELVDGSDSAVEVVEKRAFWAGFL